MYSTAPNYWIEPSGFFLTIPVDPLSNSANPPGQVKAVCRLLPQVVKSPGRGSQDSPRDLEKWLGSRGWTHRAGYIWSGLDFAFVKHFNMQQLV